MGRTNRFPASRFCRIPFDVFMRLSLVVRHYSFHWEHIFLGTIFIHEKTAPIHQRIVLELMPATTVRTDVILNMDGTSNHKCPLTPHLAELHSVNTKRDGPFLAMVLSLGINEGNVLSSIRPLGNN